MTEPINITPLITELLIRGGEIHAQPKVYYYNGKKLTTAEVLKRLDELGIILSTNLPQGLQNEYSHEQYMLSLSLDTNPLDYDYYIVDLGMAAYLKENTEEIVNEEYFPLYLWVRPKNSGFYFEDPVYITYKRIGL